MNTKIIACAGLVASALLYLAAPLHAAEIQIGSVQLTPGGSGTFDVRLNNMGEQVAGTDNRISFDPATPITPNDDGDPDCEVNSSIRKESTEFVYEPLGCAPGVDCDNIRALVLSLGPPRPIPNNARLYTCNVEVLAGTPEMSFPLSCFDSESSDPNGVALPTTCVDGDVIVTLAPAPTPTGTPNGGGGGGGGGCEIAPLEGGTAAWALLGPAGVLLARRRRRPPST